MDSKSISTSYQFRGVDYVVCLCPDENDSFTVEVEDKTTADQWRSTFDAAYIEDLTHKTGNFKQYKIFLSMLESAIAQTSDSVSVDLLTYADLESLRNRKTGAPAQPTIQARSTTLNSKRYLILTYTVEFDRIHYPLPLPYMGKPDPRALQEVLRELREENKRLQKLGTRDLKHKVIEKLQHDYDALLQEKEEIEADFIDFKRQVQNTTKGAAAKEIRVLKGMVKHLEQELVTERTKQQRKNSKLGQDYRQVFDELEELRASERNLRVRVKSLTNELNVYKRGQDPVPLRTSLRDRSSSRENSRTRVTSRRDSRESSLTRPNGRLSRDNSLTRNTNSGGRLSRDNSLTRTNKGRLSRENSLKRNTGRQSRDNSLTRNTGRPSRDASRLSATSRDSSLTRPRTLNSQRERSLEWERQYEGRPPSREGTTQARGRTYMRDTANTRGRSESRERSSNSVGRRYRSPSPASVTGVPRSPRFDPTAFIQENERKRKESEQKLRRQKKPRGSTRPHRPSSAGSLRSRTSSIESLSDIGMETDASQNRRLNRVLKPPAPSPLNSALSSPDSVHEKSKYAESKILASTPDSKSQVQSRLSGKENRNDKGFIYNRTEEISEIDERLNRLKLFMKQNLQ